MVKDLERLMDSQVLCSIFSDYEDPEKFSCGYIIGLNDYHYLFEHISPDGDNDGISFRFIKDISKIEIGTIYNKNIQRLMDYKKTQRHPKVKLEDNNVLSSLFSYCLENKIVVIIELGESGKINAQGLIRKFDDEIFIC